MNASSRAQWNLPTGELQAATGDGASTSVQPEMRLSQQGSSGDVGSADAAALQTRLKRQFGVEQPPETVTAPPAPVSLPKLASLTAKYRSRLLKSLFGLALVVTVGWMPAQRLFQVSSVEAVVNARLVTLRAPIAGIVDPNGMGLRVGGTVPAGGQLAVIANPLADRQAVDAALDAAQEAQDNLAVLSARKASLVAERKGLAARLSTFHENRFRVLRARIDEADAAIASAEAVEDRAQSVHNRQLKLGKKKLVATAALEDSVRDLAVAKAATLQERARRDALVVERQALMSGTFFGQDYNDRPQSGQQLDEIDRQIASIDAEISGQERRAASTKQAAEREARQFTQTLEARLVAPVGGRVWEILAAPGEQVVAGQEIASLVNCSEVLVTAAVSESVYNSLSVGMPASFTPREGGETLSGRVMQLSGVATASSNFAILPSALTKESYRVAVSIDGAPSGGECTVGRTGRVVFGSAAK